MAKKKNNKKSNKEERYKISSTTIKNMINSVGKLAYDTAMKEMPTVDQYLRTGKTALTMPRQNPNMKINVKKIKDNILKDTKSLAKDTMNSAIKDLKTGKIYNPKRGNDILMSSMFDMDM